MTTSAVSWPDLVFRDRTHLVRALAAVAIVTVVNARWLGIDNPTTVALTLLFVVLVVAATSRLWVAVVTSTAAMLSFNFFFLPPIGTLSIAEPQNWVALFVFLAVSLVASNLSSVARARTEEALSRRDEMARLFALSRDVLLTTDSGHALTGLARDVARRFDLDHVAICLPDGAPADGGGEAAAAWDIYEAGAPALDLPSRALDEAFRSLAHGADRGTGARGRPDHRVVSSAMHLVRLMPLRVGSSPRGLLATSGREVDAGTLDALAGVVAMAIERAQFLAERQHAEIAHQREELKSALLASFGHDLRTPLTSIRVAASNLQASWLTEEQRAEQSGLVLAEVERLTRRFQNLLEMARIEAGPIPTESRWVDPAEIVAVARDQVAQALSQHEVSVDADGGPLVCLDPRLTAAALSHVLENAAQYTATGSSIAVSTCVQAGELVITVRDQGAGIAPGDLPRLFERFYRGVESTSRASGTGMGLSIARGLLAAESGRIWAENAPGGGAAFTIAIPAASKAPAEAETAP